MASLTDTILETTQTADAVRKAISSYPETSRQSKFFALFACAAEQAVLMEQENPGIFAEHGGRDKWAHGMLDTAMREMEHGLALRGKLQN